MKSLFNAESGANFALDAELPIDEDDWRIGVIVAFCLKEDVTEGMGVAS